MSNIYPLKCLLIKRKARSVITLTEANQQGFFRTAEGRLHGNIQSCNTSHYRAAAINMQEELGTDDDIYIAKMGKLIKRVVKHPNSQEWKYIATHNSNTASRKLKYTEKAELSQQDFGTFYKTVRKWLQRMNAVNVSQDVKLYWGLMQTYNRLSIKRANVNYSSDNIQNAWAKIDQQQLVKNEHISFIALLPITTREAMLRIWLVQRNLTTQNNVHGVNVFVDCVKLLLMRCDVVHASVFNTRLGSLRIHYYITKVGSQVILSTLGEWFCPTFPYQNGFQPQRNLTVPQ